MKRTFLFQLLGVILAIGMISGLKGVQPVQAADSGEAELTLSDLGLTAPQILTGPLSESSLLFNLPLNWMPQGGARLELNISAFFSSLVAAESTNAVSGLVGGDLSVYLNDTLLGVTTLTQAGQQTVTIEFDGTLLKTAVRNSVNMLKIRWDGSISCSMNLLSSVTVMPNSKMIFNFGESSEPLTLNSFPSPFIVEKAIRTVPLKIVLPAAPSAGELRAAMILAAGVGQISGGQMTADIVSMTDFRVSDTLKQNVFFVANTDTLKTLSLATYNISEGLQVAEGEGLLYFFEPKGGYGMLVSGDETGIIMAAQAAAANQVIAGGDARIMVISSVNPSTAVTGVEDMTLEELGVGEMVFTQPDQLVHTVDFFVPAGNQVRSDASFNLVISHSQQLDYLSSGLQMKVNGYPAVSLRLNDNTSNQAAFTLIMPANLVHPGRNTLEFVADLSTRDLCTAPTETVAWLRVSSSSLLHLPLESAVGGNLLAKTFGDFPNAFLSGSGLNDITMVIAPGEIGYIRSAAKLANLLGAALPDHTVFGLNALFSDFAEAVQASANSMILIGKPSDFPALSDKTAFPSMVFTTDNSLSDQSVLQLVGQPEAGTDVGYLAIRGFDVSTNRILMAVLGNGTTGVELATNVLTSVDSAKNNFVMVVADNVQSGWLDDGIATGELAPTQIETPVDSIGVDPVQAFRRGMMTWVVPALAVMLAVMLLFIYIEIRQAIQKNR